MKRKRAKRKPIYVCIYVYMYVCMYVCICTYVYVHICMSKPAYTFFNRTFTTLSSTGQKVLQTCPSLTKLLPTYIHALHIIQKIWTYSLSCRLMLLSISKRASARSASKSSQRWDYRTKRRGGWFGKESVKDPLHNQLHQGTNRKTYYF